MSTSDIDMGLAALADDACAKGALAHLRSLYIGDNPTSQQSQDALTTFERANPTYPGLGRAIESWREA